MQARRSSFYGGFPNVSSNKVPQAAVVFQQGYHVSSMPCTFSHRCRRQRQTPQDIGNRKSGITKWQNPAGSRPFLSVREACLQSGKEPVAKLAANSHLCFLLPLTAFILWILYLSCIHLKGGGTFSSGESECLWSHYPRAYQFAQLCYFQNKMSTSLGNAHVFYFFLNLLLLITNISLAT